MSQIFRTLRGVPRQYVKFDSLYMFVFHHVYFTILCLTVVQPDSIQELVLNSDLAIETGIFDFANINFMQGLPALGPDSVKAKGKDTCFEQN